MEHRGRRPNLPPLLWDIAILNNHAQTGVSLSADGARGARAQTCPDGYISRYIPQYILCVR